MNPVHTLCHPLIYTRVISGHYLSHLWTNIPYKFLTNATFPAHLILLDFIMLMLFDNQYKL